MTSLSKFFDGKIVYRVKEAAIVLFGKDEPSTRKRVRALVRRGELDGYKPHNSAIFIPRSSLKKFLKIRYVERSHFQ